MVIAFVSQDSLSLSMSHQYFVLQAVVNDDGRSDIMTAQLAMLRPKLRADFENCSNEQEKYTEVI